MSAVNRSKFTLREMRSDLETATAAVAGIERRLAELVINAAAS